MRVLWVTEEPPDRGLGGGNIRQAHLVEALAAVADVHLVAVGPITDDRVRAAVAELIELPRPEPPRAAGSVRRRLVTVARQLVPGEPVQARPWARARRQLRGAVAAAAPADVVHVEHEALARLLPARRSAPWVLGFQNVLSSMAAQHRAQAPGARHRWVWGTEVRRAQRLERWALGAYDHTVACSTEDARTLEAVGGLPTGAVRVVPNGVELARFEVTPVPPEPLVLFPGTLGFAPNVDGALWFAGEIWPRVRAAVPAARLAVVGRQPVAEVLALAQRPGVEVHGDVASLVPWFERARVVVVPLRVGTGTRLKAIEAMAAARPVVGTTIGLEGLGIVDGEHARVADDVASVADAVVRLLTDDGDAAALAAAGRRLVAASFDWSAIGARYADELRHIARPR